MPEHSLARRRAQRMGRNRGDEDRTPEELRQRMLGVAEGWSKRFPYPDLEAIARDFIRYYRTPDGCSNCGGLPHSTMCFVGRFERALAQPPSTNAVDPSAGIQESRPRATEASALSSSSESPR